MMGENEAALSASTLQPFQTLLLADDWLDEEFAQAATDRYQQYLLYCDPLRRFSVVSFVWEQGQQTPIHDPRVWGMVGMLRGAEVSRAFEIVDGRPVARDETRLEPGDVLTLSPAEGDIHQVRNGFNDRVSISVHIYGGDIGSVERRVFPVDGGIKLFVSGYANHRLPNYWGRQ